MNEPLSRIRHFLTGRGCTAPKPSTALRVTRCTRDTHCETYGPVLSHRVARSTQPAKLSSS
jgi:hypothetical protein